MVAGLPPGELNGCCAKPGGIPQPQHSASPGSEARSGFVVGRCSVCCSLSSADSACGPGCRPKPHGHPARPAYQCLPEPCRMVDGGAAAVGFSPEFRGCSLWPVLKGIRARADEGPGVRPERGDFGSPLWWRVRRRLSIRLSRAVPWFGAVQPEMLCLAAGCHATIPYAVSPPVPLAPQFLPLPPTADPVDGGLLYSWSRISVL